MEIPIIGVEREVRRKQWLFNFSYKFSSKFNFDEDRKRNYQKTKEREIMKPPHFIPSNLDQFSRGVKKKMVQLSEFSSDFK